MAPQLPLEMVLEIFSYLKKDVRTLGSLSRVSRHFHQLVEPALYRAGAALPHCHAYCFAARHNRLRTLQLLLSFRPRRVPAFRAFRRFPGTPYVCLCFETPLHLAVRHHHHEVVELLLANHHPLSICTSDSNHDTPLDVAARCGTERMVALLADVTLADTTRPEPGRRDLLGHALFVAALRYRLPIVKLLLEKGAAILYWERKQVLKTAKKEKQWRWDAGRRRLVRTDEGQIVALLKVHARERLHRMWKYFQLV